jgi:hypothetical protein
MKKTINQIDNSSLNCWFRQQGGRSDGNDHLNSPKKELNLPIIKAKTNSYTALTSTKLNKRKFTTTTTTTDSKEKRIPNFNNEISSNKCNRNIHTPFPAKSFYSRCIEDVINSNMPHKMKLSRPRELEFVKNSPFYKYITFSGGQSCENVWQIEIS